LWIEGGEEPSSLRGEEPSPLMTERRREPSGEGEVLVFSLLLPDPLSEGIKSSTASNLDNKTKKANKINKKHWDKSTHQHDRMP
jgi:hypothetical protein